MKKGMHRMPSGKMMKDSDMPKLGTGAGRKKYGKKKMAKSSLKGRNY